MIQIPSTIVELEMIPECQYSEVGSTLLTIQGAYSNRRWMGIHNTEVTKQNEH